MDAVFAAEAALRELLRPDKVNLASLGNMTQHLHWHVIPRFADDRHFPQPIWAQPSRARPSRGAPASAALADALRRRLGA
jgi:diadenosine tetraphosphate (Ap4A) HIT family hydrolase